MAIIAVDSSGHVGQPPIFFVASRLKRKHNHIDYNSQVHHITRVNRALHDSFINTAQGWRLKLSAVLIYDVAASLLHSHDQIVIDVDFDVSNRRVVRRYLNKLLFVYHQETPLQQCSIEFVSQTDSEYVKIADYKTKRARRHDINDIQDAIPSRLNEYFELLRKIK